MAFCAERAVGNLQWCGHLWSSVHRDAVWALLHVAALASVRGSLSLH